MSALCQSQSIARRLFLAAALALAACEGGHVTDPDPDDVPDINSVAVLEVSVPSGSIVDAGTRMHIRVFYRARQQSELQARLLDGPNELAASALVRADPGSDEETLVLKVNRPGQVDLIEVILSDPDLEHRVYDVERVLYRLTVV